MWNKTISIFAIALLIMGAVPIALAESGRDGSDDSGGSDDTLDIRATADIGIDDSGDDATDDRVLGTDDSDDNDTNDDSRLRAETRLRMDAQAREDARIREQTKERLEAQREEIEERLEAAKGRLEEQREITKERIEAAKDRYEAAKERYQEAKERYRESRGKIEQAREKFAECRNDDSAACVRVRTQVKTNAQPFLLDSADMVLEALDRIQARVEADEDMDASIRAETLAKIETQIAEVEAAKVTISNLDNSSTADEIQAAAKTIREAWQETRKVLRLSAGHVINAKLGNIVQQTEQLSVRIHATRDRLEAQGKDVSGLDAQLADFDGKLGLANDEWQAAVDLYASASPGDVDAIAQEAHDHVQRAKEYLKEVRDSLRGIVNEIKAQNSGSLEVEAEAETTVDDETVAGIDAEANASADVTV